MIFLLFLCANIFQISMRFIKNIFQIFFTKKLKRFIYSFFLIEVERFEANELSKIFEIEKYSFNKTTLINYFKNFCLKILSTKKIPLVLLHNFCLLKGVEKLKKQNIKKAFWLLKTISKDLIIGIRAMGCCYSYIIKQSKSDLGTFKNGSKSRPPLEGPYSVYLDPSFYVIT